MPEQMLLLGNLVIMVAYAAIMVAIVVPLRRARQLWSNKLATATALIFFSCSIGHGLHAVMSYRTIVDAGSMPSMSSQWIWASAVWDTLTAVVGVFYWTLRRGYGVLLGKGAIYVDPDLRYRLDQAGAREQEALSMLAAVVEHSADAIIGLGVDGRINAWNGGAEQIFGYTAEEMIGQTGDMLTPVTERVEQLAIRERIAQGEKSVHYEAQRLNKNGDPVTIAVTIAPVRDSAGTLIAFSAVAHDITAEKEAADRQRDLEERTHQSQRMESLGKLAGGVAHDFNNILAIIMNYTEFAAEMSGDDQVRSDLSHVRTAAERAMNLTRQLLTFTRGDTIQPQDVDLNGAVAEVRAMLERTIGEHITLITTPAPQPVIVHADPGQIHQVLLNLAINARDALGDGGTLVLEVATVALDGVTHAELLVSDTGEGMPAEVVAHVFEPFYTTKPRGMGTGLGLATVYGIVAESGGGIDLQSEPGVGTTFRIHLPLVAARSSFTAAPRLEAPPDGGGRSVLVVEDEESLARVVDRILTDGGYQVLAATGGAAAIELFDAHGCDLLVTDVIMPEMSGPQLASTLRDRRPGLPVLFMSGYSDGLLGGTRVLDPAIPFIEKPFTGPDLLRKVSETLIQYTATEP